MEFKVFYYIIILLNLLILSFIYMKIYFSKSFLNKFSYMALFMLMVATVNVDVLVVSDMSKVGLALGFLSIYSMFLVLWGYGMGLEANTILLFKMLSDVMLMMIVGSFCIFKLDCDINLYIPLSKTIEAGLMVIFLMYSLVGIFGFWIYWAMEASYFVSVHMHSCGFISLGVLLFCKLIHLEVLSSDYFQIIYVISLISYLFFVILFLTVVDMKKSFGYFSASSICLAFVILLNSPSMFLIYFFLSSVIKVYMFELMSYMGKIKYTKLVVFLLGGIDLSNYSLLIMLPVENQLKLVLFFMFGIKSYCLMVFLMSVWNTYSFNKFTYIRAEGGCMSMLLFVLITLITLVAVVLVCAVYYSPANNNQFKEIFMNFFDNHLLSLSLILILFMHVLFWGWFSVLILNLSWGFKSFNMEVISLLDGFLLEMKEFKLTGGLSEELFKSVEEFFCTNSLKISMVVVVFVIIILLLGYY